MSALSRELSQYEVNRINEAEIDYRVSHDLRTIRTRIEYLELKEERYNIRDFSKRFEDLYVYDLTDKQAQKLRNMRGNANYFTALQNIRKVSKSNKIYDKTVMLERYLKEIMLFTERAESYSWFNK